MRWCISSGAIKLNKKADVPGMTITESRLRFLEWTVRSRAKNQVCAVKLLGIFEKYEDRWKTKQWSRAAQELTAVAFSLWRAAFLADKTNKRAEVFKHGRLFLERLIEDNAISYPQDKTSREWTFNYYTRNARYALKSMTQNWPAIVPEYQDAKRGPMERWDYCQSVLDTAVTKFAQHFVDEEVATKQASLKKAGRTHRREKRAKVRKWLADRSQTAVDQQQGFAPTRTKA